MPVACRLIDKKEDRDAVGFNHVEVIAHIHNRVKTFLKEHSSLYVLANMTVSFGQFSHLSGIGGTKAIQNDKCQ